ncbi:acetyl-CoA synthetase-like protein [Auriscalpium vulgare]|uniref:Acetyl-CoA synthetase-like protein n=1 Tax=Auriscalpium vulgare TaxID=40419 RepID=A0ACB8SDB2_9AGAM|nr:acetyl-CoA synthetase-like protein [Auriscalpium vulgare]
MAHPLYKAVPLPHDIDYSKQGVEVPGTKRPGQTGHYQNAAFGYTGLKSPGAFQTLPEVFETGLALSRDLTLLGHRPIVSKNPVQFADHYVWQTYAQVDVRRRNLGSAIHSLFEDGTLAGGELPTVGIWSQNRPEWQIVEWALNAYGKVSVSLYETLGQESVEYIINHAQLTSIFTTSNHLAELIKLAPKVPQLKLIVTLDEITPEAKQIASLWASTVGISLRELKELEEYGAARLIATLPVKPDQVASICYTSGTTSVPKGVILTQGLLAAATYSNLYGYSIAPTERGVILGYLPLAHIYERLNELAVVSLGGAIGYFSGDPLRLLEDALTLKPNFFPSVPRVLNRIYQAAMLAGGAPGLKGAIFRRALEAKLQKLHTTGEVTHALWDRIIQAVLGGNIKLMVCGSAPISAEVVDFLKIAFACDVIEGKHTPYGMTENGACCTKCLSGDPSAAGTVGPPQPGTEIKLVDVPSMKYLAEDKPYPRGEICCRGDVVFSGYYKDPKNTAEAIDEEGWVHTGDVGEIDNAGRLRIIDRVKNIMKLAQGEYVALEKVENTYATHPLVAQIFVHGDSLKSYVIGVVVPDPAQLAAFAGKVLGRTVSADDTQTLKQIVSEPKLVNAVLAALTKEGEKHLKGFELLKRIHVSLDPFSVDDNTMTPTFKLRRKDAYNKYKTELDAMYALPDPVSSHKAQKL